MNKVFFSAVSVIALAVALPLSTPASAQIGFKMAYIAPPPVWGPVADRYAEEVAKLTNGEIKIQGVGGGQLGNLPQNYAGLKTGQISMMLADTGTFGIARGGKDLSVMMGPYVFQDKDHFRKFVYSKTFKEMLATAEAEAGFKYVGYVSDRAPRQLTTSNRKVMTPEDLKGLKVRVPLVPAILEAFKAWGATPTPVAGSELYLALKQGIVEGQDNGFDAIVGAKLYEVQKYAIRTNYIYSGLTVIMAQSKWDRLSPEHQKALEQATIATEKWASKRNWDVAAEAVGIARKNGMEILEPDLAPFKATAADTLKALDGKLWSKGTLEKVAAER